MKEEEGPTIDFVHCKEYLVIISISHIIIKYFPVFFGRCNIFLLKTIVIVMSKTICFFYYKV